MCWNRWASGIKDEASSENHYTGSMPASPPKAQARISLLLQQVNFLAGSCNYITWYGSGNTHKSCKTPQALASANVILV